MFQTLSRDDERTEVEAAICDDTESNSLKMDIRLLKFDTYAKYYDLNNQTM